MTSILLVDDDPGQLRLLARALSLRSAELEVFTAKHGGDAIEILSREHVDVLLSDLQMPEVNGFELLAWTLSHRPDVVCYSMTAYPDEASSDRFRELGGVEAFTKPLDVSVLLERITTAIERGVRGQIKHIGLPSFLQLLEMEQKTCALVVESGERRGSLFLAGGRVVDARHGRLDGLEAALEILAWDAPLITIRSHVTASQRSVDAPMGFLIMEAMRLSDERASMELGAPPPVCESPIDLVGYRLAPASTEISEILGRVISFESRGAAIVDPNLGVVTRLGGEVSKIARDVMFLVGIYESESRALAQAGGVDEVREIVVTGAVEWTLLTPMPARHGSLLVLRFDASRSNLVMERQNLARILSELALLTG